MPYKLSSVNYFDFKKKNIIYIMGKSVWEMHLITKSTNLLVVFSSFFHYIYTAKFLEFKL
jgi:hypothetical protein